MDLKSAINRINKKGMLLVFPAANRDEPASLWSEFFPNTEMRWEWDDSGDNRVAELWHLRERLSTSRKVIYTKWFRGRATLISFELFEAMLCVLGTSEILNSNESPLLSFNSREVLDLLDEDSPQSTKMLKKNAGLQGRESERHYNAAMKDLWAKLYIVAFGEVDEGAFPSLAMGSTKVLFEDLVLRSLSLTEEEAWRRIDLYLPKTVSKTVAKPKASLKAGLKAKKKSSAKAKPESATQPGAFRKYFDQVLSATHSNRQNSRNLDEGVNAELD